MLQKGLGHLAALYLLLLLVARYKLSYHKTICYHLFQYLQRIPCWKPLIISFCSSLGSTLLLIERTTIDPLYSWVVRLPRGVTFRLVTCICYYLYSGEYIYVVSCNTSSIRLKTHLVLVCVMLLIL